MAVSTVKFLLSKGKDARSIKNKNYELPTDLARWHGLAADISELSEFPAHKDKKVCTRSLGSLSSHETMHLESEKVLVYL